MSDPFKAHTQRYKDALSQQEFEGVLNHTVQEFNIPSKRIEVANYYGGSFTPDGWFYPKDGGEPLSPEDYADQYGEDTED